MTRYRISEKAISDLEKIWFYTFLLTTVYLLSVSIAFAQKQPLKDYPIQPVNFTKVKVTDHFWAPRIELNQKVDQLTG